MTTSDERDSSIPQNDIQEKDSETSSE